GHILRLDRAEAKLLELRLIQDAAHHGRQFRARRQVAAIAPQIDSAQDDLSCAYFRAPRDESPHLFDHCIRSQASAIAANEWDDAIGAAIVAAVLNLQDGPRAVPGYQARRRA